MPSWRSRPSGPAPMPIASMPPGPPVTSCHPWPASPWRSRTTSAPRGCAPPAPAACWRILFPPTNPPSPSAFGTPARCWWARPTSTSSPWAARPRPRPLALATIPGTRNGCRGGVPAVVPPPWPPARRWGPWAPTPAARSASPLLFAAWLASNPPMAASVAGVWWPLPAPSTRWGPSPPPWPMRPNSCR